MITRSQILVRGLVQGVGFRPFVYSQASRWDLRGRVFNNTSGVLIEVEGTSTIERFVSDLTLNAPPLSAIESVDCSHDLTPADYAGFEILESGQEGKKSYQFPPMFRPATIASENCLIPKTVVTAIPLSTAQTAARASRLSRVFPMTGSGPQCASSRCVQTVAVNMRTR